MENDILKQAALIMRNNRHKYSVSAMCDVLQLPKSTYYYETKEKHPSEEDELTNLIVEIFHESRQNYGTRKIKHELYKKGTKSLVAESEES